MPPENVVERETEIGAAYVRAMDALDACYTRLDPICSRTLSFRARTDRGCAGNQLVALPLQAIDDLLLLYFGHRLTIHAAGSIGYPRSTAARRRCNRRRE